MKDRALENKMMIIQIFVLSTCKESNALVKRRVCKEFLKCVFRFNNSLTVTFGEMGKRPKKSSTRGFGFHSQSDTFPSILVYYFVVQCLCLDTRTSRYLLSEWLSFDRFHKLLNQTDSSLDPICPLLTSALTILKRFGVWGQDGFVLICDGLVLPDYSMRREPGKGRTENTICPV